MTIIIPSKINSELENILRQTNPKECNIADFYGWSVINQDCLVTQCIISTFEVAEQRSLEYNEDYILHLSSHTYNIIDYPGTKSEVGYTWDSEHKVFYPAQPFQSWSLNTTTWLWQSPIPYPSDGLNYIWDEELHQADLNVPKTTGWVIPFTTPQGVQGPQESILDDPLNS
jgi:hypothetical protein